MITKEQIVAEFDKKEEIIDNQLGIHCVSYNKLAEKIIKIVEQDLKDLQHFKDAITGLYATDKPELITEKHLLFKIK